MDKWHTYPIPPLPRTNNKRKLYFITLHNFSFCNNWDIAWKAKVRELVSVQVDSEKWHTMIIGIVMISLISSRLSCYQFLHIITRTFIKCFVEFCEVGADIVVPRLDQVIFVKIKRASKALYYPVIIIPGTKGTFTEKMLGKRKQRRSSRICWYAHINEQEKIRIRQWELKQRKLN